MLAMTRFVVASMADTEPLPLLATYTMLVIGLNATPDGRSPTWIAPGRNCNGIGAVTSAFALAMRPDDSRLLLFVTAAESGAVSEEEKIRESSRSATKPLTLLSPLLASTPGGITQLEPYLSRNV